MRHIIFFSLFCLNLVTISPEDGMWPFTSSYWEEVTIEELQKITETEININTEDPGGYPALLYAAGLSDDPEIITLLIEKGAEIDKKAGSQWTPLMFAVSSNNNSEISKLLIENGADINAIDARGYTVLMTAASWSSHPAIIRMLLDAGADINSRNPYSHNTALMYAAGWNQNMEIAKLLIEKGSNIETRDNEGRTALMLSAELNKNSDIFFTLMAINADLNKKDIEGRTILMLASAGFNPEIVESLYNEGADIEAYDAAGLSVWDYISQNENMQGSDIFWKMNDLYFEGTWQSIPEVENEQKSTSELESFPTIPSTGINTTESLLKILSN